MSQISESFLHFYFHIFVLWLILMLTCKLFQKFVVLARIFRFWNYSLSVSSLLLNSSRVLIAGLFFLICSASNVSNLMLLDAWSIIFQLNSDLPLSLPHYAVQLGYPFSVFLNPCGEMSDRLANIDGFAPTTFKSVHHF